MSQEFISHDGADANGVRAEVVVVKGRGVVTDIVLGNKDRSVQVSFMEENLKNPIKGWANVGTPIHTEVLRAKETGEEVNYRIEIQRKSFIPREQPMEEVRPKGDMITANKNAIRILAAVNDVVSDEAVTHPSEDTAPVYGRHKATGADARPVSSAGGGVSVNSETVLTSLKALVASNASPEVQASAIGAAIALGVAPSEVFATVSSDDGGVGERPPVHTSFSGEGKPWEWWNSDGSENLGHARFAAGQGAESFVRKQLTDAGVDNASLDEGVAYFTGLLLSIADRVQEKIYGQGYRPDRASASHGRIRGIIYDSVENYYPLPVNVPAKEDANGLVKAWIAEVGNAVFERFQIVVNASNAPTNFSNTLPVGIYGEQPVIAPVKAEKPVVEPEVAEPKADIQKVEESVVEAPVASEPEPVVEEVFPEEVVVEEETVVEVPVEVAEEDFELAIFAPVDISSLPEDERNELASDETVAYFRELIEEANIPDADLKLVANLLRKTFGKEYSKAQQLPESVLTDFIDFYAGAGEENLRKVIQSS